MLISYRDKKREDANRIITTTDFDYRNPCRNVPMRREEREFL